MNSSITYFFQFFFIMYSKLKPGSVVIIHNMFSISIKMPNLEKKVLGVHVTNGKISLPSQLIGSTNTF